ncbi:MAG: RDD family protein, partial [Blastocatellia bacterium]
AALMKSLALKSSDRFQQVEAFQSALASYGMANKHRAIEPRMKRCNGCGASNVGHAKHCAICGASLASSQKNGWEIRQPGELKYAGFERRIAAWLIDSAIVGCAWLVAFLFFLMCFAVIGANSGDATVGAILLSMVLVSPAVWLYYSIMESSRRQGTVGKVLMGISVTDLAGERVSFWRSTGRHFAKTISAVIAGIGFLMPLFSEKKQALHDSVAGCLILSRR